MLTLLIVVPLVIALLIAARILRLLVSPFAYRRRGYCTGLGFRRRHHMGGSLVTILALVALDRLFTGRRF